MDYLTQLVDELNQLKLDKLKVMYPEEVFQTYTEFPVKSVAVYRHPKDLSVEEQVLFDKYKAMVDKEEFERLSPMFAGICLSCTEGWSFLLRRDSIILARGFNEDEVIFLRPVDFGDKGVGFLEISEDELQDISTPMLGNTFEAKDLEALQATDRYYFNNIVASSNVKKS